MRNERIGCEAPTHDPDCECRNCNRRDCRYCPNHTLDHFTGKAIGRMLGVPERQINSQENFQYLSPSCHKAKDHNTNGVLRELSQQRRGRFIGLGEHVQIGLDIEKT